MYLHYHIKSLFYIYATHVVITNTFFLLYIYHRSIYHNNIRQRDIRVNSLHPKRLTVPYDIPFLWYYNINPSGRYLYVHSICRVQVFLLTTVHMYTRCINTRFLLVYTSIHLTCLPKKLQRENYISWWYYYWGDSSWRRLV